MTYNKEIKETVDWLEYILKESGSGIIKNVELPRNEDEFNYLRILFTDGEIRTIKVS